MSFYIDTNRLTDTGAAQVRELLSGLGVRFGAAELTVRLYDDSGELAGTGSLDGNVLKYIGVSPAIEGEGGCAAIVSALVTAAYNRGIDRLFLYTKPQNHKQFASLGFYELARTADMLLMENKRTGLADYLSSLPAPRGKAGAVVMNANPFTNGHLYLCEQAAQLCDTLYIFVVSEDRSLFPADARKLLVERGTAHIENAVVCESRDYLVSWATFPDYFIREESAAFCKAELDIVLFCKRIAPALNITVRFAGSEPYSPLTAAYNAKMAQELPKYGIAFTEFERTDGISASRVRSLMGEGRIEEIRPMVPKSTYEYIRSHTL